MARLRASEHHVEGPGDQPRRRGRKHGASSPVKRTASQRTVSPGSVEMSAKRVKRVHIEEHTEEEEVEEQVEKPVEDHVEYPALSQQTPEPVDDDDMDELQMPHTQPDTITLATPAEQVRRARRRFSEPLGANDGGLETPTQSVRQIKHAQSRRARMSMPAQMHRPEPLDVEGVRQIQYVPLKQTLDGHLKRRLRRNHLSEEMNDIEDQKKREARMKKALADLHKDLESKRKQIEDLEFQLESRRLGDIELSDDQTADLRQQLATAHQEIEELRNSTVYTPGTDFAGLAPSEDYDEDEELVLTNPADMGLPEDDFRTTPLPNGYYASRSVEASQITVEDLSSFEETTQDRAVDRATNSVVERAIEASTSSYSPTAAKASDSKERSTQRYEAEIEALLHRLADAQGALRCLTIELQNLDIINPGASATDILAALRGVLESSRDRYEKLFSPLGDVSNSAFIERLVVELEGMNKELLEKVKLSNTLMSRVKVIEAYYESSMGLLAAETEETKTLTGEKEELDAVNAEQKLRLEQLNNSLDREAERVKQQDETIRKQVIRIQGLEDTVGEKETDIVNLTTVLDNYRQDIRNLEDTVKHLEQDHADRVANLTQEHATVVSDLENRLDAEIDAREQAEDVAAQRSEAIEEQEARISQLESEINDISDRVEELSDQLSHEKEGRSAVEAQRSEQAFLLEERADEIDSLKDTIDDREAEIEEIKMNLVAERTQRQQTEADLTTANEKIERLNKEINDHGTRANELREKLWERQEQLARLAEEHKEEVNRLKNDARQLTEQSEERRQESERQISDLEIEIEGYKEQLAGLQDTLAATESARNAVVIDRDELRQTLERQLEELRNKYAALESSKRMQIDTLNSTITDLTNENHAFKEHTRDLEQAAVETATKYEEDMSIANDRIATLEEEKAAAEAENARLSERTLSLERRVEGEATELLNIMGAHAEESNALRSTIDHLKTHIANLEESKREETEQYEVELAEKNRQIEELTIVSEARGETVIELQAQVEELKDRFRKQAEDSQATIDALLEKNRIAIEQQEQLAAASQKRTQDALKALTEMKTAKVEIRTQGVNLNKVVHGKVGKVNDNVKVSKTKKKKSVIGRRMMDRPRDSGFVEFPSDMDEEFVAREASDEGIVS